ncbi:MAG: ATP-dependent helicase HrpB, partial [Acidobacteriota bacterium]|nr:ATP-dependent helicase HrpB [Acidobacteriota bacterium]
TRLRFLTEGVLTRRMLRDPILARVGAVVLDEFHERHLQADLALALLRRLQLSARPDMRIIAMSATLDAAPVARFLGDCPVLRSQGRLFDVEIEHLARSDETPLASQVEAAVRRLVVEVSNENIPGGEISHGEVLKGQTPNGDVLVFLPGAAEIRRAQEACAGVAAQSELLILPLHGELPPSAQDRAVSPASQRKIILSTNVAETSVTIDGVVAVIDSGLARVASHSPWSGLPTLNVERISQASAIQRAGRAGRTRPGTCLRLYTAQEFAARPAHDAPEIQRLDLADTALELHAAGITDLSDFEWFEAPPAPALAAAETLLLRLGAIDEEGKVTALGERMLRLPLHPRLARVVIEAEARGVAEEGCVIAALISERDIRADDIMRDARERSAENAAATGSSDLLQLLDLFTEASLSDFAPEQLRRMKLNVGAVGAVDRVRRQLLRLCRIENPKVISTEKKRASNAIRETELLISVLAGYPDRVARRRTTPNENRQTGRELLLAGGGAAELSAESVVRQAEFLVAVDAAERRTSGARSGGMAGARSGARTLVRIASAIEPDWLLDLFTDRISETIEAVWNATVQRVEVVQRLMYDELVIDERRASNAGGEAAARVLAEAALAAGVETFIERDEVDRLLARIEFIARTFPEIDFPDIGEDHLRDALVQLCEGRWSFAELREAARAGGLQNILRRTLSAEQQRVLASAAPDRVTLAGGRQVKVNYECRQTPWVASRMQDFFGMKEGPKIAGGRVTLVLHLLAPNNRPVQVTEDLAGFWERHYPRVRRELSRRYPRHAWPEHPLQTTPKEK